MNHSANGDTTPTLSPEAVNSSLVQLQQTLTRHGTTPDCDGATQTCKRDELRTPINGPPGSPPATNEFIKHGFQAEAFEQNQGRAAGVRLEEKRMPVGPLVLPGVSRRGGWF